VRNAKRLLRGYFWRAQITQLFVVVAIMTALNAVSCFAVYMVGHSMGVQHERGLSASAKSVFSDYLASGTPFVVDMSGKKAEVNYVYRSSYNTYTMKRPKMEPQGAGGGER